MKRWVVFLIVFMMVPAFGAYKLVLKNGAVLELVKKPDLSGKQVTAETVKGRKIIFSARIVDRVATKLANQKKPAQVSPLMPTQKAVSFPPAKSSLSPEKKAGGKGVPLVLTNETLKKAGIKKESNKGAQEETVQNVQPSTASAIEEEPGAGAVTDDHGYGEAYWRGKFQENQKAQTAVLNDLKKKQLKMNKMTSRRLQTDDELEKRDLTGKIQELQKRIDKAKAYLQNLKKNKEKLLEDARTSGALPGWYRDYED